MIVHQLWIDNPLRNFNYVVECPHTKKAVVIDPLSAERCLEVKRKRSLEVCMIVNTHEHGDHTAGNAKVQQETGAPIACHEYAAIKGSEVKLKGGDRIELGETSGFEVLHTPGHTHAHISLRAQMSDAAILFSGDTLFHAGIGNCWQKTGDPVAMFHTFATIIKAQEGSVRIYPGHDYIHKNLEFCKSMEPDNPHIDHLLNTLPYEPNEGRITTMKQERQVNCFLRLGEQSIHEQVQKHLPELKPPLSSQDVFLALRTLRNSF